MGRGRKFDYHNANPKYVKPRRISHPREYIDYEVYRNLVSERNALVKELDEVKLENQRLREGVENEILTMKLASHPYFRDTIPKLRALLEKKDG